MASLSCPWILGGWRSTNPRLMRFIPSAEGFPWKFGKLWETWRSWFWNGCGWVHLNEVPDFWTNPKGNGKYSPGWKKLIGWCVRLAMNKDGFASRNVWKDIIINTWRSHQEKYGWIELQLQPMGVWSSRKITYIFRWLKWIIIIFPMKKHQQTAISILIFRQSHGYSTLLMICFVFPINIHLQFIVIYIYIMKIHHENIPMVIYIYIPIKIPL